MKIVRFDAENIKRLKAVTIEPDGHVQVIAGRNAQGKSSVLDAIWMALGGAAGSKGTTRPIRDGEDHAAVCLDLGDIVVTRTWRGDKTTLKVESPAGAVFKSPQAMLDALVGRLSFDPLAFAQQDERTQLKSLLELVDLPLDLEEMDQQRAGLYQERVEVGRVGKQLQGQLSGIDMPAADAPAEPVDVAALLAQHRAAREAIDDRASNIRRVDHLADSVLRCTESVEQLEAQLAEQRQRLAKHESDLVKARAAVEAATEDLPDVDAIERQLATAEETNADVRRRHEREQVKTALGEQVRKYEALTEQIQQLDDTKAKAIADAEMPIDGLAFDATGVTYGGIPFKQASAAEQLRVSLAMAMAMNPKIRVIRITDGSLLDSANMRLIEEMAVEHDFQVWVERVDESGQVGIVIEDGQVAS